MIYIFWTTSTLEEAQKIIHSLLKKKWIMCANIIPKVYSIYEWEGKVQQDEEVKVILKSDQAFYEKVCSEIENMGSYDVPEISCIEIDKAYPPYLEWLEEGLKLK